MFCGAAHHELKMLWIWLQLLAFVTQLVSFLLFPVSSFPPLSYPPCSIYPIFPFISKSFSGFKLLSPCQSLLSDISSLTLSVCRTTILLIPLVMVCIGRGIKHHHWGWFFGWFITMKNKDSAPYIWQHFKSPGQIFLMWFLITQTKMHITVTIHKGGTWPWKIHTWIYFILNDIFTVMYSSNLQMPHCFIIEMPSITCLQHVS